MLWTREISLISIPARQPFKRDQFGGSIGGPLLLPRFGEGDSPVGCQEETGLLFFAYERLRQNQVVHLNTVVL